MSTWIEWLHYVTSGVEISKILLLLAVLDLILALSWRWQRGIHITSGRCISGIFKNFAVVFLPALAQWLLKSNTDLLAHYTIAILSIVLISMMLQSVIANLLLTGFYLPENVRKMLMKWVGPEVCAKTKKEAKLRDGQ